MWLQSDFILIENSRLDPNDPRNAKLLKLIESIPYSSEQAAYFRLVTVDDAERLISDEEFTSDRRFILLNFRDQGVISTILMQFDITLYFFVMYAASWSKE